MKRTFIQSMAWLHTWAGLAIGWLLFAVFLTGTLTVFDMEINHWMRPELHGIMPGALDHNNEQAIDKAVRLLSQVAPGAERWSIRLPSERELAMMLSWRDATESNRVWMNPKTGEVIVPRETRGGNHFEDFHSQLHAGSIGLWIVGAAGVAALAVIVTGVVIHKRFFKDFFTFRPKASAQRSWLDAHNATAVLTLPFQIMIVYSGLAIEYGEFMPAGIHALYGADRRAYFDALQPRQLRSRTGENSQLLPLVPMVEQAPRYWGGSAVLLVNVWHPGDAGARVDVHRRADDRLAREFDRVTFDGVTGEVLSVYTDFRAAHRMQLALAGLQYVEFGGAALRWLYFFSGIAGCAMIATGLLLFTVKRREKHANPRSIAIMRVLDGINVATVAGLALACIGFFWANRLLPVRIDDRAYWEIAIFFALWLATSTHALLRPYRRAWVEQLGLTAALCVLLPLLNFAATSHSSLVETVPRGDWMTAGVDLTALIFGTLLAYTAWKVSRAHSRPGKAKLNASRA